MTQKNYQMVCIGVNLKITFIMGRAQEGTAQATLMWETG